MASNTILAILLITTCAILCTQAVTAPASAFARAQIAYGSTFIQDEMTTIAVAFYNASGSQINPATIDLTTVSVHQAVTGYGGLSIYGVASSGYGILLNAVFLTAGAQSFTINVNGASLSVSVYVNPTTFASASFILGNIFNVSTVYTYKSVAFYKPSGAQINPQAINVNNVSVQSVPAGISVSNIADSAYGIQFTLSFSAPGYYTIYINLNGQRVSLNATVLPANTGTTTAAPTNTCYGEVLLVARTGNGGSWTADSTNYKIFDVNVVNKGTCSITSSAFPFYFILPGTITSSWNMRLDSPQGYGSVTLYGPLAPGSTYSGAGFIIANYTTFSGHYSAEPVMCSSC